MNKIRVAVVGTGWWASDVHIPALLAQPRAQLVALCDIDAKRLKAAATKYSVAATYTDLTVMLEKESLDAAIVVTSNASHYRDVKACLEHGLHVLVEKPMTLRAKEAKALIELAEAKSTEIVMGYSFNFYPYFKKVREVLRSGKLGQIQYVQVVYNSDMLPFFKGAFKANFAVHGPAQYVNPDQLGGGHGQVQLTHALGLLFYLTDLRPARVGALMANHGSALDLVDAMSVAFTNGALGNVGGTGNQEGLLFRLLMNCERGWIDIDAGARRAAIHVRKAESQEIVETETVSTVGLPVKNLVAVVGGEAKNGSPAEGAWRAVEVLEAAYRSAEQDGIFINIEELYENY